MDNRYFKLLIVLAFIFVMPLISANAHPVYGQGTNITLSVPCTLDGDVCSSTTSCVATIIDPEQLLILNNQSMIQNDAVFEVNLTENQTEILGQYELSVSCCDSGDCQAKALVYLITTSGAIPISPGEGFALLGLLITLVVVTIFFLVATIFINNPPFKLFLGSMSSLIMVGTLGFGVTIMQQLLGSFDGLVSSYGIFFRLFTILLTGAGIGVILFLVVLAVKSFNKNRGLIDDDDDFD